MGINRRTALLGGGAALVLTGHAWAQTTGRRAFEVIRNGKRIGEHIVTATREGDLVRAHTDINIAVSFLGITAYRYTLSYDETYRDGMLQTFSGTANDDGEAGYARVTRQGGMLKVDGSSYSGDAPGNALPTSYWRMAAIQASPWISAQTGLLLPVGVAETSGSDGMPQGSRAYAVRDNSDYSVELWYDAAGEWTGCAFDAGGERGVYRLLPGADPLAGLAV